MWKKAGKALSLCYGDQGRNRKLGESLAKGNSHRLLSLGALGLMVKESGRQKKKKNPERWMSVGLTEGGEKGFSAPDS